jgi:hypothetical protein
MQPKDDDSSDFSQLSKRPPMPPKKNDKNYSEEILTLAIANCKPKYPATVRKILASSFHELVKLKPNYGCLPQLLKLYDELIRTAETETPLIAVLCSNLEQTLSSFLTNVDVEQYVISLGQLKKKRV